MRSGSSIATITFLLAGLLLTQCVWASSWQVDTKTSRIGFIATYDAIEFEGFFRDFTADIHFNPRSPEEGLFEVNIGLVSVDTDSPDRDEGMLEAEWFDAGQYPHASFISSTVEQLAGEKEFAVTGNLTIKGITRPVTVSFTWTETGPSARLKGQASVNRGEFNIGSGEWAEDDTIGFDVGIVVDLTLTP